MNLDRVSSPQKTARKKLLFVIIVCFSWYNLNSSRLNEEQRSQVSSFWSSRKEPNRAEKSPHVLLLKDSQNRGEQKLRRQPFEEKKAFPLSRNFPLPAAALTSFIPRPVHSLPHDKPFSIFHFGEESVLPRRKVALIVGRGSESANVLPSNPFGFLTMPPGGWVHGRSDGQWPLGALFPALRRLRRSANLHQQGSTHVITHHRQKRNRHTDGPT